MVIILFGIDSAASFNIVLVTWLFCSILSWMSINLSHYLFLIFIHISFYQYVFILVSIASSIDCFMESHIAWLLLGGL